MKTISFLRPALAVLTLLAARVIPLRLRDRAPDGKPNAKKHSFPVPSRVSEAQDSCAPAQFSGRGGKMVSRAGLRSDNLLSHMQQKAGTQPTHWSAFYLLLLLVVVVSLLIGVGLKVLHLFGPSLGTSDATLKLDSFSEPSIAAAILRQYAQDLFSSSNLGRDPEPRAQTGPATMPGDRGAASEPVADKGWLPLHAAGNVEGAQVSSAEQLERLQQEIKKLNTDLAYELMYVHFANRQWNEFLDCYLQLLQAAPDRPDGRNWAHWALAYSSKCGRTDEVVDALRHMARFHPDLKTTRGLKAVLEEWTKDAAGFEVPNE